MRSRLLMVGFAVLSALALVGCGDDDDSDLPRIDQLAPASGVPGECVHVLGVRFGAGGDDGGLRDGGSGAVADAGVRDLDVSILAPDGRLVAADLSKDPWSVVPPRGPWCPDEEGPFAIDVSVADGEGAYVIGLWGSESE